MASRLSILNLAFEMQAEQMYGLCAEQGPIVHFEIVSPLRDYELVRAARAGGAAEVVFLDGPGGARLARGWRRVTDGADAWYAHIGGGTRWDAPPWEE